MTLWVDQCWSLSWASSMPLILQHVKWFLFLHLWHFCPMLSILLVGVTVHICCMAYLGCLWASSCYPFCNHYHFCNHNLFHWQPLLSWFYHLIYVSWSLWRSFHAPWHAGGGLCTWCPFFSSLIWPISWLQNVLLHETATLSYVPFSLLWFGTGITQLYLWYVDWAGPLSLVLPVRCHCISHLCGSSRMLTLPVCQQRPWKLHWDFFYFLPAKKW